MKPNIFNEVKNHNEDSLNFPLKIQGFQQEKLLTQAKLIH